MTLFLYNTSVIIISIFKNIIDADDDDEDEDDDIGLFCIKFPPPL